MASKARRQVAPNLARRLTVTDLAKRYGIHRTTCLRWLRELDRKTRGGVIMRTSGARRSKIWTTHAIIREGDRRWLEHRELQADRLEFLEKKTAALESELRTVKRLFREALSALKALPKEEQSRAV